MEGLGSLYSSYTSPNYVDVVKQSLEQSGTNTGGLDSLMPTVEPTPVAQTSEALIESERLLRIREAIKEKENKLADEKKGSKAYNKLETTIDTLKRAEELEKKYTQPQTQFNYSAPDILKRYTQGTEKDYSSTGTSQEELLKKIEEQQKALGDLEFTQTKTRKVPVYSYYEGRGGAPGIAGFNPGVARTTTQIPEGSTYRPASQQGFISTPAGYIGPDGVSYTQQGTKNITETFTRPAKAGDKEYDKAQASIDALQRTYDLRNKYTTGSTGTQGFIGDPLVNQGQTGYNTINEILKRYIG